MPFKGFLCDSMQSLMLRKVKKTASGGCARFYRLQMRCGSVPGKGQGRGPQTFISIWTVIIENHVFLG